MVFALFFNTSALMFVACLYRFDYGNLINLLVFFIYFINSLKNIFTQTPLNISRNSDVLWDICLHDLMKLNFND